MEVCAREGTVAARKSREGHSCPGSAPCFLVPVYLSTFAPWKGGPRPSFSFCYSSVGPLATSAPCLNTAPLSLLEGPSKLTQQGPKPSLTQCIHLEARSPS